MGYTLDEIPGQYDGAAESGVAESARSQDGFVGAVRKYLTRLYGKDDEFDGPDEIRWGTDWFGADFIDQDADRRIGRLELWYGGDGTLKASCGIAGTDGHNGVEETIMELHGAFMR